MPGYWYIPLPPNSIRVLVIHPGPEKAPISCHFRTVNLESGQRYDAISYVWGEPTFSELISLEAQDHYVTPSLRKALEMTRSDTEERAIWADQLCINQNDLQERSSQVGVMSLIYMRAEVVPVIINAGGDGETVANLVELMKGKIEEQSEKHGGLDNIPTLSAEEFNFYNSLDWQAVKGMLSSPWFSRAWVVQEVGLAATAIILYGRSRIEWDSLMLLLAWLSAEPGGQIRRKYRLSGWTVHHIWTSYDSAQRTKLTNFPAYSFLDILGHTACTFKATNSRDHIYAFLGHPSYMNSAAWSVIKPDYESSTNEVYLDFATKWLEGSQQPYILSCVDHDTLPSSITKLSLDLPSWCPRWDQLRNGGSLFNTELEYTWYRASKDAKFRFNVRPEGKLKVDGFIFDVLTAGIRYLEESTNSSIDHPLELRLLDAYQKVFACNATNPLKYESLLEAFAATSTAGYCGEDHGINCFAYMTSGSGNEPLLTPHDRALLKSGEGIPRAFADHSAETTTTRRRIFSTRKGYLGIGPKVLVEGDICCILFGARVPYILRPLGDSRYFLVGECYIHGLMLGEAMDMYLNGGFKDDEFVLL